VTWHDETTSRWAEEVGTYTTLYIDDHTLYTSTELGRLRVGPNAIVRYASRRAVELHLIALSEMLQADDDEAVGRRRCTCGDPLRPGFGHRDFGACLALVPEVSS